MSNTMDSTKALNRRSDDQRLSKWLSGHWLLVLRWYDALAFRITKVYLGIRLREGG